MRPASIASLDSVAENVLAHLGMDHHTALVAPPGSGTTTLVQKIHAQLTGSGKPVFHLDFGKAKSTSDALGLLNQVPAPTNDTQRIVILDHLAKLDTESQRLCVEAFRQRLPDLRATCLWSGPLDARVLDKDFGLRIHSSPRSHISFPLLARDEMLAAYRSIVEGERCRWGEAILYLALDFCGNDLALVKSMTEYLHGDWSDKLYDKTIWDRMTEWLRNDSSVDAYRQRITALAEPCRTYLALMRLGGKPPCPRAEVLEEVDDALRFLCLSGFIVPNLLPGFYQLRNLTIRFLICEPLKSVASDKPELLFRRSTNERIAQILQDVESMLRYVLLSVFGLIGQVEVRATLEKQQGENEFIPAELNRALLAWADGNGGLALRESLNSVLIEHRKAFRKSNSVWARVTRLMEEEETQGDSQPVPEHLRCLQYMTLRELSDVLIEHFERAFPRVPSPDAQRRLRERWRENLSKVLRLRNRVAHLRNVEFQDVVDLTRATESMRRDLIDYGGWR